LRQHLLASLALGAFVIGGGILGGANQAHAAEAGTVRGTIESVKDGSLDIRLRNGSTIVVGITPSTGVADVSYAKISDIKPDSFIGTAAIPQPDGTLKALEVHVFASSLRGTGEGNRPWEGETAKGSMTNGTVGSLIGTEGRTLTVTYKGGQKKVVVPDDVPIVNVAPGTSALLTPGAHIVAFGTKGADGTLTATRILAGENGVVPPM
jgi:hypothetical protein